MPTPDISFKAHVMDDLSSEAASTHAKHPSLISGEESKVSASPLSEYAPMAQNTQLQNGVRVTIAL